MTWTCGNCGADNPPSRSFCLVCGAMPKRPVRTIISADRAAARFDRLSVGVMYGIAGFLAVAGCGAFLLLVVLTLLTHFGHEFGTIVPMWVTLLLFLGIPVYNIGFMALRRAQRKGLREKATTACPDATSIIYLRPFVSDGTYTGQSGLSPSSRWMFGGWRTTPEEALASALKRIGPCFAIGNPREELPELGFIPIYTDDDSWQIKVQELVTTARIVVVRASRPTPAVIWEIETVIEKVRPSRLLIFLPFELEAEVRPSMHYEAFKDATGRLFPIALPRWSPGAMLIAFASNWRPSLVCESSLSLAVSRALAVNDNSGDNPLHSST